LADTVLQRAKTILDKVKVYDVKIQAAGAQGNLKEAIKIGLQVLKQLGVSLPEKPSPLDIQRGFEETASLYVEQEIADLVNLPDMTELEPQAAIYILSSISAAAYIAAPELMLLIVLSMVNLAIKYGHATWSAFSYACHGLILCGVVQDIELGYKFGKLGLSLTKRLNATRGNARAFEVLGGHVMHWKEHFKETLPILIEGYQSGVETGEFEFAGFCAFFICDHLYFIGHELTGLEQKIATYGNAISQIRRENPLNWIRMFRQVALNLLGRSKNPSHLIGDAYNEEQCLPLAIKANDRVGIHLLYLNKLILCYLFGEEHQAAQNAVRAEQYLDGVTAMVVVPLFHFYDSLAHLGVFADASTSEKEVLLNRVKTNQEKMKKWADNAPMNYLHKYELVEAEKARVLGQNWEAAQLYELAISGARENGYLQEEALAYELAAKFYEACGMDKFAQTYMSEAYYAYTRWGATAKVKDLEARYPQLLTRVTTVTRLTDTPNTTTSTSTTSRSASALDLATVMKATQAISGEIVLDKLLGSLMKILIENAGAQAGHLILETEGKLLIEASGEVDSDNITVLQSISIDNRLPTAIINYVVRTKETVVLNDAIREGNFTLDPYIKQHQVKSILCTPLLNQGQLGGIVYLENNLTTGAFTPNRLEVLQLLSGQAAISIENARLYQTLDDKVKERTAQLAQANQEISTLNERLKEENLRLSAELDVTRQLQQMILPKPSELEAIEGLEIAGFMEPAEEVGGDYYDVLQQEEKVKIGIGDVTGHGLESGVLMLMTQTAVRTLLESNQTDPVKFLDILNRTIYRNIQRINPYKDLTLALLDYADGIITLSGQHEEMIVVRTGGKVERVDTRYLGFPIGIEEDIAEFIATVQVQLNPGDVVVLYTDGITEAEDINRDHYGLERLCEVVSRHWKRSAQAIKEAVIEDVRSHIGEQKVFDDITLVVLKQK
jgi:serine phosphatase RsbU (regulator of sigma subunit)